MRQELAAIKLIETAGDVLPEPYIVIDVVFHQLLLVFVRRTVDIGGNAVKLGL